MPAISTSNEQYLSEKATVEGQEDLVTEDEHVKATDANVQDLVYDDETQEPALHLRTYVALAAMLFYNFAAIYNLVGTSAMLSYISVAVNGKAQQIWIVNAPQIVQVVIGPVQAFASDYFQARKMLLLMDTGLAFIGVIVGFNAKSVGVLILGQIGVGFGFAATPMVYTVCSEILPKKWRPIAQALLNISATSSAIAANLMIGALTSADELHGWRRWLYVAVGLWGITVCLILFGYKPPKRHTRHDHLSFWEKIRNLDLMGTSLLTTGLCLFLAGLTLGGNSYPWTNVRTLVTLILGLVVIVVFGLWEWKGTQAGILHHELWRAQDGSSYGFMVYVILIGIEGVLLYSVLVFYPIMSGALFTPDPFKQTARNVPFWLCALIGTSMFGWGSSRFRSIRVPLATGFLLFTAGVAALASIEPGQSVSALTFSGLAGLGFGAPLILIIAGAQLIVPHHLMATASAVLCSARGIWATIFISIFTAAYNEKLTSNLPTEIVGAAVSAGVPAASIPLFVAGIAGNNATELEQIPGLTANMISLGAAAAKQANADSIRYIYIIAAPFGVLAIACCFLLDSLKKLMNYRVDAPVEALHAKAEKGNSLVPA